MKPVLFRLGPINVQSYTALLAFSIVLGLWILYLRARRRIVKWELWLDGALVALIVGVLGARLGYVIANWAYYQDHVGQIAKFWLGGLEWRGALIAATLGTLVYCRLRKLDFWSLVDELALIAPLIGIFGWLGCLLTGCAYGKVVNKPHFLEADLPDLFGVWALRYNVQLLAAGWSLLVACFLWWLQRKKPPAGSLFGALLMIYGSGMAFTDTLRGDGTPLLRGIRLGEAVDWIVAFVGLAVLAALYLRGKTRE
jgi:phosphatidylglycerol:prolipoprotein diacylglycerol transferase